LRLHCQTKEHDKNTIPIRSSNSPTRQFPYVEMLETDGWTESEIKIELFGGARLMDMEQAVGSSHPTDGTYLMEDVKTDEFLEGRGEAKNTDQVEIGLNDVEDPEIIIGI